MTNTPICAIINLRSRLLVSVGNTTFEYDAKGRRTKKGSTEYYYDGDKLIAEVRPTGTLYFFYDESGVCGMRCNGANYEFVRNIFGDVIGIYNEYGTHVATYAYDAWGNMTYCNAGTDVAYINPFLYRGYYYDSESGLYYLMTRYYDTQIGQFISMDTPDYLDPETIGGVDLYAYGLNNPVMYVDPTGHFVLSTFLIGAFLGAAFSFVASVATQALTDDKEINWGQVALDTVVGGISGALGASGISKTVSIVAGGILGFAGSLAGDIIAANGDLTAMNWGETLFKASVMGTVGALAGRWTGAGAQNSKAMADAINKGTSWGSKAFLTSAKEVAMRPNSGLTIQTMYMNMAKAITKYKAESIGKVTLAIAGSTWLGNFWSW